jgi:hypothetical protein
MSLQLLKIKFIFNATEQHKLCFVAASVCVSKNKHLAAAR